MMRQASWLQFKELNRDSGNPKPEIGHHRTSSHESPHRCSYRHQNLVQTPQYQLISQYPIHIHVKTNTMPWKWLDWMSCKGKSPFSNRVTPSSTSVTSCTVIAGAATQSQNKTKATQKRKGSKSRSRPSNTNLPELIMKQIPSTLKGLECPVCKNTCVPPIYPCVNGHLLCSSCRVTRSKCPVCSEDFSTTRNLFAEQFVVNYTQPCKYAKDGCTFLRWKGCDMKPHEISCFYRPIQCIVPSCIAPDRDAIPYRALLEHLIDSHKVHGTTRLPAIVNFQTDTLVLDRRWLPYYIKSHGCDFYLMLEARRPHFWSWVWVQPPKLGHGHNSNLGSASASTSTSIAAPGLNGYGENFVFISTLIFHNPEQHVTVKWSGPVHSIRTPSSIIIQEGLCFGGSEAFMQHFETADKMLSLTLNIEKKLLTRAGSSASLAPVSVPTPVTSPRRSRSKSRPTPTPIVAKGSRSSPAAAISSTAACQRLYPALQAHKPEEDLSKGEEHAAHAHAHEHEQSYGLALDLNNNELPPPGIVAAGAEAVGPKLGVRFALDGDGPNRGVEPEPGTDTDTEDPPSEAQTPTP